MSNCGTTLLTVAGATCQRVALASTFMLQFCCGIGDCEEAATKRSDIFSRSASGGAIYLKNTSSSEMITPLDQGPARVGSARLTKRDCGDFVVTGGPYSSIGQPQRVSPDQGCGPTGACSVELDRTATQSRTLSVSLSVGMLIRLRPMIAIAHVSAGDPWGVISASVGVEFTESSSKSWTTSWDLGEGSSGYVVYTPYTICYKGHFAGDCAEDGQEVEACYPETLDDGTLNGKLSVAVTVV